MTTEPFNNAALQQKLAKITRDFDQKMDEVLQKTDAAFRDYFGDTLTPASQMADYNHDRAPFDTLTPYI